MTSSFESDREHLLSNKSLLPPSLYSTSAANSTTTLTTTAPSIAPDDSITPTQSRIDLTNTNVTSTPETESEAKRPTPYKGFPSEEAYLEALRSWVSEKTHIKFDTALIGWQGTKTMQDYANQPGIEFAWRTRMKERKAEKQRRATIAEGASGSGDKLPTPSTGRRLSSAFRWSPKTSSPLTTTRTR